VSTAGDEPEKLRARQEEVNIWGRKKQSKSWEVSLMPTTAKAIPVR